MNSLAGRLVVVSNRLPIVLEKAGPKSWSVTPGSGGLVRALAPVLSHRGGVWIGWSGVGGADELEIRAQLTRAAKTVGYDFQPVLLTQQDVVGFYLGYSNSIIWPLFHDLLGYCNFDPAYWYTYLEVNRKFARAVQSSIRPGDFIWVHDYQLIHLGAFLRQSKVERKIGFFLHIPFPPLDIFVRLPWRAQMLRALLAYDLLGFQTWRDRRNFLTCLQQLMPDVDVWGKGTVVRARVGDRVVSIGSFPIGIDFKSFARPAAEEDVARREVELREKLGSECQIVLGIDRLDYTKGVPERLLAFRSALERYPDLRGKVILFQVVVPSREEVPEYVSLKKRVETLVGAINGRFGVPGWVPIHYHYRSLPKNELLALYGIARIAFVTPLKDGMNLVAKEYCACNHGDGTLVLSEFAGAAAQLQRGAFLVNPYDIEGMGDTLKAAVDLPEFDRRKRMKKLRETIRKQDIFWWVDRYLRAAFDRALGDFQGQEEYLPRLKLEGAIRS